MITMEGIWLITSSVVIVVIAIIWWPSNNSYNNFSINMNTSIHINGEGLVRSPLYEVGWGHFQHGRNIVESDEVTVLDNVWNNAIPPFNDRIEPDQSIIKYIFHG